MPFPGWISEWVHGSSVVTWIHLFMFMTQRIGEKNRSSERCFLPPSPFVHLQSGISYRTWEAVRGCGEGYWFVLNASYELFSLFSLWTLTFQTPCGICMEYILDSWHIIEPLKLYFLVYISVSSWERKTIKWLELPSWCSKHSGLLFKGPVIL